MSPPPLNPPTLFPEPVPGGSIIGSVGSHFAAAFTLYQSQHPQLPHPQPSQPVQTVAYHSHAPTNTSFNSDFQPPKAQIEAEMDGIIKSLSRTKIEGLVTLAWIRRIPQQEEGKLRGLVSSAVRDGLLNCDDIYATQMNSFARLPTTIQLRIVSYLPLRTRIVFLKGVNHQFTRLAHHPQLWTNIDLSTTFPFQPTLLPLSTFLTKYTPATCVHHLTFHSSTPAHEFLKFLITLKRLRTRLQSIHLHGKQIQPIVLAALESLLGKWTHTLILSNPCSPTDVTQIAALIAVSSRLKRFALHTTGKVGGEYDMFVRELMRAGETARLHHRHPEMNTRLRVLQLGCVQVQNVRFAVLAEMGRWFPLLEMLRLENWKVHVDVASKVVPIKTLRGLSLLGIEFAETKSYGGVGAVVSAYVAAFAPTLEYFILGAKETDRWKIFSRKPELRNLFSRLQTPTLKVLWLRGWSVDYADLLGLEARGLRFLVVEECKGMNGGWIKAVQGKWTGISVVETDTPIKEGIDFRAVAKARRQHG